MANQTIQNSIDYALTYIQYSPLSAGTNSEPAITIANEIQNLVCGPPFTWAWNRGDNGSVALNTTVGTQDYTTLLTDFAYLETASSTDSSGAVFNIPDVYNNLSKGKADPNAPKQARPNAICVYQVIYGTSVKIRLMGTPNAVYGINLTYQKLISPMTALTGSPAGTWTIPPQYSDIYNNLFTGEAMAVVDDARANIYRQRGVTALLAKSDGLTEMQKNQFLEQFWARAGRQEMYGTLRTQQSTQARSV
jgi:hypothetical protein